MWPGAYYVGHRASCDKPSTRPRKKCWTRRHAVCTSPRPADPTPGTTDSWAKEPPSGRGRPGGHGSRGELPEAPFLTMTPWETKPCRRYFCFNFTETHLIHTLLVMGKGHLLPVAGTRKAKASTELSPTAAVQHPLGTPLLLGARPVLCVFTSPISRPVPITLRVLNE